MAMTVRDVDDFLRVLREHPEWRERVRREVLGDEILALPERMSAVEHQLAQLTVQVQRLAEGQEALQRGQESLQRGFESLQRAVESLQRAMEGVQHLITELTNKHGGRLDNLEGQNYEWRYAALNRVGERGYRRAQRVYVGDIEPVLDARDAGELTDAQVRSLAAADFIVRARNGKGPDAPNIFVVLEVSVTVHDRDVQRAADRAAILRAVGLEAVGWVGGRSIGSGARLLAEQLGVEVLLDRDEPEAA